MEHVRRMIPLIELRLRGPDPALLILGARPRNSLMFPRSLLLRTFPPAMLAMYLRRLVTENKADMQGY